jgi:hypothetical protein
MQKMLLLAARGAAIAGIILITIAVFIESYNVASLSTSKAALESFNKETDERYKVEEPVKPVDLSKQLAEPVKPADDATEAEKTKYDNDLAAYQELKKAEEEDYAAAQKDYEKARKQYDFDLKMMKYNKYKEEKVTAARKKELENSVKLKEIDIGVIEGSSVVRLIGTILLLIGAFGVLVLAENLERLGVLILLGFAFKTIIGL